MVMVPLRPALAGNHRRVMCRDGPRPIQAFVRALIRGASLCGDPFGVPGCNSLVEPFRPVGAAERSGPVFQELLMIAARMQPTNQATVCGKRLAKLRMASALKNAPTISESLYAEQIDRKTHQPHWA